VPNGAIAVRPARPADIGHLAALDFSFAVDAVLAGPFDGPGLPPATPLAAPYRKTYGFDPDALAHYLGDARALFVAVTAAQAPVGYIAVSRGWNGYASVDDLAVDAAHRGRGAARGLMEAAVAWARAQDLAGVRLETQHNNVAACRFYARHGFVLGGHDRHLYTVLNDGPIANGREEIALFWYLFLDERAA
jgi:streptothricin acetyltransferase